MKPSDRETFARMVHRVAPGNARRLFQKARTADLVSRIARGYRSYRIACDVRQRLLEAARRVNPDIFRRPALPLSSLERDAV
jgi:hypothetical protein